MSASVAPPMAGLPNYDFGAENMPDFTATDFPDHMELDRSNESGNDFSQPESSSPTAPRRTSASADNNAASRKEAIGNLLGALLPNQNEPGREGPHVANADSAFSADDQLMTNTDVFQGVDQGGYDLSQLPPLDATVVNELFSAEDFTELDQTMNMPQTPNGSSIHYDGMPHLRHGSLASQASVAQHPATPQQREFEAFARLQFEDGSYYLNTYACELGRDVLAYRAALAKEKEERETELSGHEKSRSSSGRASHRSSRMIRQLGSQMQGSVVSEQGGFAGIDEVPMGPPQNPEKPSMSSQESESSVVKPAEYLINPRTMPSFDYHRSTELQAQWTAQEENNGELPDDEQPAAVTAAHLPNPHMCPLIPVHGRPEVGQTDTEMHKKISRRHVKIAWSFDRDCWEMKIQGRNGVFCDGKFVRWKAVVPLRDGTVIQIAHVICVFRLPKTAQPQQETQLEGVVIDADEALPSVEAQLPEAPGDDERRESITDQKATPKISLKITQKTEASPSELPLGPDGLPIIKRRGPGRPPKDGIMSTRERRERERAAKLAAAREANGGRTPPPMRAKLPKPTPPAAEEIKTEIKPEKRKYTKRRNTDENGELLPDEDGEGEEGEGGGDEPKSKKARTQREKSESPEYPPRESLTAEQLARPPESYAILLHKLLLDVYPRALPLKEIYRELKKRYPWYVYEAQTEGWQSSVRHNLNSEFGKLFDKGDKEGKGFAWRAIPTAQVPQSEKKRTTATPAQRPRPPPQRPQFQSLPGQNVQWQNTGAFPNNVGQQPFINHGHWPQSGPSNSNWQQNGSPSTGSQPPSQGAPGLNQPNATPQNAQQAGTQGVGQGPPANIPPPPSISFSSAPSNMPCTLDGIEAITRFEKEMYRQMKTDEKYSIKKEFWMNVFASSKKRVLHGHDGSTHPKGDSKEEQTIMLHLQSFVDKFKNPNFKGFRQRPSLPPAAGDATVPAQVTTPIRSTVQSASPALVTRSDTADIIDNNKSDTAQTAASPQSVYVAPAQAPSVESRSVESQLVKAPESLSNGTNEQHNGSVTPAD